MDPRKSLPDRRLLRGAMTDAPVTRIAAEAAAAAPDAAAADAREAPEEAPLRITVTNGDLTFESEPLLLGHYQALQLTGTEKVMDRLIGGAMTRSLEMGVYPVAVGLASDLHQHPPEPGARLLHASPQGRHHRRPRRGGKAAAPPISCSRCARR